MQNLVDKELLIAHKLRAQKGEPVDFLAVRLTEDLIERLSTVKRRFERAATLFCNSGEPAKALRLSGQIDEIIRVEAHRSLLDGNDGIVAEPEIVPLESGSIDLAVSLLALQDMNDVPGFLIQVRRALRPDGLFLAAFAGAGTLTELRESLLTAETELYGGVSPRVLPFMDVRDAGGLLQRAGFALPVTDHETVTVRYPHMFALIRDLRAMGATSALSARSRKPVSRRLFQRAAEIYAERFADEDGRIRATFTFVWMSGWAPHESQQKPLARGSAKMSFEEALRNFGDNEKI